MTLFDHLLVNVFNYYKKKGYKNANSIAIGYVSLLQIALMLFLGVFFAMFFRKMHVDTMSSEKAWILFVIGAIVVHFKNWLQYSGKKRTVLNAKRTKVKTKHYNVPLLWLLPVGVIGLSIILLQGF